MPAARSAAVATGDAALTRRVRAAGESWSVAEKRGRKVFSRGVWAPGVTVERVRAELEAERSTGAHSRRREADVGRRLKAQEAYVEEFRHAALAILKFHPNHAELADRLARALVDQPRRSAAARSRERSASRSSDARKPP